MSTADDQLASFVRRIESLDDEIKVLNDDKASVYQEAKGNGFNVKVLRKVIAARRKDAGERDEEDALFDLYWASLHGVAHARVETQREFPPDAGSSSGRTADFDSADEGSNPSPATPSVPEPAALDSYEAAAPSSDESAAPIPERLALERADPPRSGDAPRKDAYPAAPEPTRKFRPHCLHPDRCAGYGQDHCFSCQQAIGAAAA